jgi:hypothetical protein
MNNYDMTEAAIFAEEQKEIAARTRLERMMVARVAAGGNDDDVISLTPLFAAWDNATDYREGDIVRHNGEPYCAIRAVPSGLNWSPSAAPSEWASYHGRTRATALTWRQPTGAHDMYRAGEWMIWQGSYYECIADTAYSPGEYAGAWVIRY